MAYLYKSNNSTNMKQLTVIFLLLVLLLMTACNKNNTIQPINNSVNNTVGTGGIRIEAKSNTNGNINIGMSYNSYDLTNNIFFESNTNPYVSAFTIIGYNFTNLTAGQTYYYKCNKTNTLNVVKTGMITIIKDSTQYILLNMN